MRISLRAACGGGLLLLAVLAAGAPLYAQIPDLGGDETDLENFTDARDDEARVERPYELYLWRSYILNSIALDGNGQNLVFEGQLAPNLILYQTLHRQEKQSQLYEQTRRWVQAVSVSLTPLVRLRMIDTPSQPVRTPSYMPTFFTGQFFLLRRTQALEDALESQRLQSPVEMLSATLAVQHHSNGQDGCLFTRQVRVEEDCLLAPGADPDDDTINRLNGSFSTNRIFLSLAYRRIAVDSMLQQQTSWYLGPRLEINPTGLPLPGGITDEIHARYGPTRLRLFGGIETNARWLPRWLQGQQWLEGWGEYLFEPLIDSVSPLRLWLEAGFRLDALNGLGGFARFYSGQDYYNLGFASELSLIQFGLVFSASPAQSFELSPAPAPEDDPFDF